MGALTGGTGPNRAVPTRTIVDALLAPPPRGRPSSPSIARAVRARRRVTRARRKPGGPPRADLRARRTMSPRTTSPRSRQRATSIGRLRPACSRPSVLRRDVSPVPGRSAPGARGRSRSASSGRSTVCQSATSAAIDRTLFVWSRPMKCQRTAARRGVSVDTWLDTFLAAPARSSRRRRASPASMAAVTCLGAEALRDRDDGDAGGVTTGGTMRSRTPVEPSCDRRVGGHGSVIQHDHRLTGTVAPRRDATSSPASTPCRSQRRGHTAMPAALTRPRRRRRGRAPGARRRSRPDSVAPDCRDAIEVVLAELVALTWMHGPMTAVIAASVAEPTERRSRRREHAGDEAAPSDVRDADRRRPS